MVHFMALVMPDVSGQELVQFEFPQSSVSALTVAPLVHEASTGKSRHTVADTVAATGLDGLVWVERIDL
jgi:hypothetical protein